MREESHLDDMRAAIRGDFERLAQRRGGQELMREPAPPDESDDEPAEEPVAEPAAEAEPALAAPEPDLEPAPEPAPEPAASADVEPQEALTPVEEVPTEGTTEEAPRRSFLDRLLGR